MSVALFLVGFAIVTIVILDIIYTVLAPNGSGYITGKLTFYLWRLSLKISGYRPESKLLRHIGPFMMLFIVQFWVLFIWIGNAIIVYSDPNALVDASGKDFQPDFITSLYFTGYVLSAMGHGDYLPATDWWKIYTAFISFTGVIFISLAISYLLPVIQAVTGKRALSLRISSLGNSPEDIICKNWNDDDFKYLIKEIKQMKPAVFKLSQQHLAYPVIHYFHSQEINESAPVSIAMIDETLTLLIALTRGKDPDSILINDLIATRSAITYFLSTLESGYIRPGNDEPELPGLDYLKDLQLPGRVSDDEIWEEFNKENDRRKLLLAYVQNDAWKWEDVVSNSQDLSVS